MSQFTSNNFDRVLTFEEFNNLGKSSKVQDWHDSYIGSFLLNDQQATAEAVSMDQERVNMLRTKIRGNEWVGWIMNQIHSLANVSTEILIDVAFALVQNRSYAALRTWMERSLQDAPGAFAEMFEFVVEQLWWADRVATRFKQRRYHVEHRGVFLLMDQLIDQMQASIIVPETAKINDGDLGVIFRSFGVFKEKAADDILLAETFYTAATNYGNWRAYADLARIFEARDDIEAAEHATHTGWHVLRSVECLEKLMLEDFREWNTADGFEKWIILTKLNVDIPPRTGLIEEFVFPRDVIVFQQECREFAKKYDPSIRSRAQKALKIALGTLDEDVTERRFQKLAQYQISAIELASPVDGFRYVRELRSILEDDRIPRDTVQEYFIQNASPLALREISDDDELRDLESFTLFELVQAHVCVIAQRLYWEDWIQVDDEIDAIADVFGHEWLSDFATLHKERLLAAIELSESEEYGPTVFRKQLHLRSVEEVGGQENWNLILRDVFERQTNRTNTYSNEIMLDMAIHAIMLHFPIESVLECLNGISAVSIDKNVALYMGRLLVQNGLYEQSIIFFVDSNLSTDGAFWDLMKAVRHSPQAREKLSEFIGEHRGLDLIKVAKKFAKQYENEGTDAQGNVSLLLAETYELLGDNQKAEAHYKTAVEYGELVSTVRYAKQLLDSWDCGRARDILSKAYDETGHTNCLAGLISAELALWNRDEVARLIDEAPNPYDPDIIVLKLQYQSRWTPSDKLEWITQLRDLSDAMLASVPDEVIAEFIQYARSELTMADKFAWTSRQDIEYILLIASTLAKIDPTPSSATEFFWRMYTLLKQGGHAAHAAIVGYLSAERGYIDEDTISILDLEDSFSMRTVAQILQIEAQGLFSRYKNHTAATELADMIGLMFEEGCGEQEYADGWYYLARKQLRSYADKNPSDHYIQTYMSHTKKLLH